MFNGSENYDDDYFKALEKVGPRGERHDERGRTNYFEVVPSSALDLALWMESDRMGHLLGAIDQGKLDEQRGVVQNEKRQGENEPYGSCGTPSRRPIPRAPVLVECHRLHGGSQRGVSRDVQEWFRTYYGAANAVLVIAGT